MSRPRPIPAPLLRRWREFRFEYLPALAFAVSVLAAVVMWQSTPCRNKAAGYDWPEEDEVAGPPLFQPSRYGESDSP